MKWRNKRKTIERAFLKACEKYPCQVSDICTVQLWHSWQHFFSSLSSVFLSFFYSSPQPPALLSSQARGQHIPELGVEGQELSLTSVYAKIQPHPSKATGKDNTGTGSGSTVLDHLWKLYHCVYCALKICCRCTFMLHYLFELGVTWRQHTVVVRLNYYSVESRGVSVDLICLYQQDMFCSLCIEDTPGDRGVPVSFVLRLNSSLIRKQSGI